MIPAGTMCALLTIFAINSSLILSTGLLVAPAIAPARLRVATRHTANRAPRFVTLSSVMPRLVSFDVAAGTLYRFASGACLFRGSLKLSRCARMRPYFDQMASLYANGVEL